AEVAHAITLAQTPVARKREVFIGGSGSRVMRKGVAARAHLERTSENARARADELDERSSASTYNFVSGSRNRTASERAQQRAGSYARFDVSHRSTCSIDCPLRRA